MAESTLTLTRGGIKTYIGAMLGISRTIGSWTAENAADVARIITAGERQFYGAHNWSFLTATSALATSNGTSTYDLPDDFAGFLDDDLAFTATKPWGLKIVPLWRVIEKQQDGVTMPSGIAQPLIAAIKPKAFTQATGQRWQIIMWPTPTSTLTVAGRYRVNPDAISDDANYPLGGQPHAQTLLESCLSAAEELMNDEASLHRDLFKELLASSIQLDQRLHLQEAA